MVDVLCDGSHAKYFSKEDVRTKLAPGAIDKHHESIDPQIKGLVLVSGRDFRSHHAGWESFMHSVSSFAGRLS